MNLTAVIKRYSPENGGHGRFVEYRLRAEPWMSILDVLHHVHDELDPTLAYRYSCRGAICGTCSMKINGTARLACKTSVKALLEEGNEILVEPLSDEHVIKDLVVDERPFWDTIRKTVPWLVRGANPPDANVSFERSLDRIHLDQLNRSSDCIKCACCTTECPKVKAYPMFIGPCACNQMYKHLFDPRDTLTDARLELASRDGGVNSCERLSVCNRVCPKDCRPLRAITFIKNRLKS